MKKEKKPLLKPETPEETEERMRKAKVWMQSPEGQAAMKKAHDDAQDATDRLFRRGKYAPKCTCCPLHHRRYR